MWVIESYAGWLPLEQLKAAFYTEVTKTPYYNRASADKAILTGIRSHEIAHRDFFEAALKKNAIPALEVDFTKTDFNSRDSVLVSVFTFEDLAWRPITALDSCWRRANICFRRQDRLCGSAPRAIRYLIGIKAAQTPMPETAEAPPVPTHVWSPIPQPSDGSRLPLAVC